MRIRVVLLVIALVAASVWLVWPGAVGEPEAPGELAVARPEAAPPRPAPSAGRREVVPLGLNGEPVERFSSESAPVPGATASPPAPRGSDEAGTPPRPYVPRAVSGGSGRRPTSAEAGAETEAEARARRQRAEEAEELAESDPGVDADDVPDDELAAKGERDQVLPPDQLEHWIEREMRRSATDYDTARTTVLSNLVLARFIAEQRAPANATPQQMQSLVDQAMNWVPNLSPAARKRWAEQALASG